MFNTSFKGMGGALVDTVPSSEAAFLSPHASRGYTWRLDELPPDMSRVEALAATLASCDHVPRVHASELTPTQFAERYMRPNLPVLVTGLMDEWRAAREWVTTGGTPDVAGKMAAAFGDAEVLVVDCDAPLDTDLERKQMPFRDFATWWGARDGRRLYLKDWTFASDFPEYGAYVTPPHFADDWLNAYWDELREAPPAPAAAGAEADEDGNEALAASDNDDDDRRGRAGVGEGTHRFVYVGVEGTWTPMHADVLRSYSWSINVSGHKRWLMVPPQRSAHLKSRDGTTLVRDLREAVRADPKNVDNPFPDARRAAPLVVEQGAGEALFVPSLWYHQVHNVTDCVSINHNWINAANADVAWATLRDEMCDVRRGLADPEDRADGVLCQSLLTRRAGADYPTFAAMLTAAAQRHAPRVREKMNVASGGGGDGSLTGSGTKRKRDSDEDGSSEGTGSHDDAWSLRVAVRLLKEGIASRDDLATAGEDEPALGALTVSGWEGREEDLAAAKAAADEGEALLAALERYERGGR